MKIARLFWAACFAQQFIIWVRPVALGLALTGMVAGAAAGWWPDWLQQLFDDLSRWFEQESFPD